MTQIFNCRKGSPFLFESIFDNFLNEPCPVGSSIQLIMECIAPLSVNYTSTVNFIGKPDIAAAQVTEHEF